MYERCRRRPRPSDGERDACAKRSMQSRSALFGSCAIAVTFPTTETISAAAIGFSPSSDVILRIRFNRRHGGRTPRRRTSEVRRATPRRRLPATARRRSFAFYSTETQTGAITPETQVNVDGGISTVVVAPRICRN